MKSKQELAIIIFLFFLSFIVYLSSCSSFFSWDDSPEIILASYSLGIVHGGYVLHTLISKLFTYLPLSSLSFKISFFSAYIASLSGILFFYLIKIFLQILNIKNNSSFFLTKSIYLSALGSIIFYYSNFLWTYVTFEQEIYPLHYLLLTGILLCFARSFLFFPQKNFYRNYFFLIFLLCLALITHRTVVYIFPLLFIYLIKTRQYLFKFKIILFTLLISLGVFSLLIFLPLRASQNPPANYRQPINLTKVINTVQLSEYSKLLKGTKVKKVILMFAVGLFWIIQQFVPLKINALVNLSLKNLFFLFYLLPFYLSVLTISITYLKNKNKDLFNFFIISFVFTFFLPIISYNFLSNNIKNYIYFFMFPYILTNIIFTLGIGVLLENLKTIPTSIILFITFSFSFLGQYKMINNPNASLLYNHTNYVITNFKPHSLIFIKDDWGFYYALKYLQFVENKRKDILPLPFEYLPTYWQKSELQKQGIKIITKITSVDDKYLSSYKQKEIAKEIFTKWYKKRPIYVNLASINGIYFIHNKINKNYFIEVQKKKDFLKWVNN